MYNDNKAQQSKNRVQISWDILMPCYIPQKDIQLEKVLDIEAK